MGRLTLAQRVDKACGNCDKKPDKGRCEYFSRIDLRRRIPCTHKYVEIQKDVVAKMKDFLKRNEDESGKVKAALGGVKLIIDNNAAYKSNWPRDPKSRGLTKPPLTTPPGPEDEFKLRFCAACKSNNYNKGEVNGYARCAHLWKMDLEAFHPCMEHYDQKGWTQSTGKEHPRHPVCGGCCHVQFNMCCDYLVGCIAKHRYSSNIDRIAPEELEDARGWLRKIRDLRGNDKPFSVFKGQVEEELVF